MTSVNEFHERSPGEMFRQNFTSLYRVWKVYKQRLLENTELAIGRTLNLAHSFIMFMAKEPSLSFFNLPQDVVMVFQIKKEEKKTGKISLNLQSQKVKI